ncbi:MAG: hypothetical protein AAF810_19230, partial [Cyanobacteria bacterium P01_D01_bin.36]
MSKRNELPVLLASLALTGAFIGVGAWWIGNKVTGNPVSIGSSITANGITRLTLLGDTFSGYSTFRNEAFNASLKDTGIEINYADEFDQSLRAEQLSKGNADLIMTTLDQYLQQQPEGKIIGLLDRTVGADAVVLNSKQYPGLNSLLD